jgi:hypothetical protein
MAEDRVQITDDRSGRTDGGRGNEIKKAGKLKAEGSRHKVQGARPANVILCFFALNLEPSAFCLEPCALHLYFIYAA